MKPEIPVLLPFESQGLITLVGILAALVATTCYNLGPAIQKEGLNELPPLGSHKLGAQLKLLFGNRKWFIGFVVGALAIIPNLTAIALVGMAVVQPLMGFGLVALVWYGKRRLGERLPLRAALGIGCLIALPAFISLAEVARPARTVYQADTVAVLVLTLAVITATCLALYLLSRRTALLLAPLVGILFTITPLAMQSMVQVLESTNLPIQSALRLAFLRFGSRPEGALLVGITAVGFLISLVRYYLMQLGLQRTQATHFSPIMQSVNVVTGVGLGIAVFRQSLGRPFLYLLALGLALIGIIILSAVAEIQKGEVAASTPAVAEKTEDGRSLR
jgi:hypothetical protein